MVTVRTNQLSRHIRDTLHANGFQYLRGGGSKHYIYRRDGVGQLTISSTTGSVNFERITIGKMKRLMRRAGLDVQDIQ